MEHLSKRTDGRAMCIMNPLKLIDYDISVGLQGYVAGHMTAAMPSIIPETLFPCKSDQLGNTNTIRVCLSVCGYERLSC